MSRVTRSRSRSRVRAHPSPQDVDGDVEMKMEAPSSPPLQLSPPSQESEEIPRRSLLFNINPHRSRITFSPQALAYHQTCTTGDDTVKVYGTEDLIPKLNIGGVPVTPQQFRQHVLKNEEFWCGNAFLKPGIVMHDDDRVLLRGQSSAHLNILEGCEPGAVLCPYSGLALLETEAQQLTGMDKIGFDSYSLECEAYEKNVVISAVPPYGGIGGLVNDYRYIPLPPLPRSRRSPPSDYIRAAYTKRSSHIWHLPKQKHPRDRIQNAQYVEFEWNGTSHMFIVANRSISYEVEVLSDYSKKFWIRWLKMQYPIVMKMLKSQRL